MSHPLLVLSVVALAGTMAPTAPIPALVAGVLWIALAGQRFAPGEKRKRRLLFALALFIVCGSRAGKSIDDFKKRYHLARTEIGAPLRCAGSGKVMISPTIRTRPVEEAATNAHQSQLDQEKPLTQDLRAAQNAHPQQSAERVAEEHIALWSAAALQLDCEGRLVSGPLVLRLSGGPTNLTRGDQVNFIAQLAPIRLFRNANLSDPWPGAARREAVLSGSVLTATVSSRGTGLKSAIDRARTFVRARINATYNAQIAPLGRALVLGESDLNQADAEAFRDSGLLHLLAVSGTHLVIAVFALVQVMRSIFVRIGPLAKRYDVARVSSAMGALLSLAYADFSGGSGSAWRAAFMLCLVCGGRTLGFRISGAAALGGSLLIGVAVDPLAGADYSFLLSALATAGLIGIGQPLSRLCEVGFLKVAPLRQLVASLIATVSSTLPCAPVLAMMDGDMTFAALFANVVAGPLGEIIALPACLVHAITSPLPALESGLALVGSGALYGVRAVALWSASVDSAQFEVPFPSPWNLTLGVGICLALSHLSLRRALLLLSFGFAGLFLLSFRNSTPARATSSTPTAHEASTNTTASSDLGMLSITALDVGQGDAIFIDFPDGKVALMDGGGFATGIPDTGERVILPYLRSRGIKHLDLVLLSHAHPDHMLGLITVARDISFTQLWLPGAGTSHQGQLKLLVERAKARGAQIIDSDQLCQSPQIPFGGTQIEVLAPCQIREPALHANDGSLVVRIGHGNQHALLTGDIEERAEALLLVEKPHQLRANLLKVGHHGSHTSSTPAFVQAVSPEAAFISCGVRNRFEHPRPQTLDTLVKANAAIFRTDLSGSLTWTSNGHSASVRSFEAELPIRSSVSRQSSSSFGHDVSQSTSL